MVTLKVVRYQGVSPPDEIVGQFRQQGGVIGRSKESDMVLPDTERLISRSHAAIQYQEGGYYLVDSSLGGTFLNSPENRVPKGERRRLHQGDSLFIGAYQIAVSIDESEGLFSAIAPVFPASTDTPPSNNFLDAEPSPATSDNFFINPLEDQPLNSPSWEQRSPPSVSAVDHSPEKAFFQPAGAVEEESEAPDNELFLSSSGIGRKVVLQQGQLGPMSSVSSGTGGGSVAKQEEGGLFEALLEGAGMADLRISSGDEREVMKKVGGILREVAAGLTQALMAESEIKSQFRITVKGLKPEGNNLLRFSVNEQDALEKLLTTDGVGFLSPVESVREGLEDIQANQLAMMAGTQAVLASLLDKFDPQKLEEQFQSHSMFGKKGRYWDAYQHYYQGFVDESGEDFHTLCGHVFAKVYEEQIREIEKSRNGIAGGGDAV